MSINGCYVHLDKLALREVTNHPVHIKNGKGKLSPSSFIPFCSFGQNMSVMGTHIDNFDVPVCNCFESVIHNDQLCYQVDLEKFKEPDNIQKQLQYGLVLVLDENEDRQFITNKNDLNDRQKDVFSSDQEDDFQIHLDTLSKYITDKFQVASHSNLSNLIKPKSNPTLYNILKTL